MPFSHGLFRSIVVGALIFLCPQGALAADPEPPVNSVIRYKLPVDATSPNPAEVEVTQAVMGAAVPLGTAEEVAQALNGGVAVPLNEVIVLNGADDGSPAGLFALNEAGAAATGADLAPANLSLPGTVTAPPKKVPYLLAQLRIWKKGAIDTGKNFISVPFQLVTLLRATVAGGITYYGLVVTHHVPHELALRATLLSAAAAAGASTGIAFLKLWYNSLLPWEGLEAPKSKGHLVGAALYKGILFISFYSYLSMWAVEVAKPGTLPTNLPEWGALLGGATVYVLSQLFWGVKFLNDQKENGTSDANLNLKMGVLAIVATAVLKYMAVDGPGYGWGYAALIGSGAAALFAKPIKSWYRRRFLGVPDVATCPQNLEEHLTDREPPQTRAQ